MNDPPFPGNEVPKERRGLSTWALVTGGSRGIGLRMAEVLARRSYNLLLVARDPSRLEAARTHLEKAAPGIRIATLSVDLTDPKASFLALRDFLQGYPPPSVLINNAGVYRTGNFWESDPDVGEEMLRVNLLSAIRVTRLVLPAMISARSGTIVFVASQAGRTGFSGATYYCASKFGIVGFAEALFEEVRTFGIKVVSLLPGYVDTDMVRGIPGLKRERMIPPSDLSRTLEYILDLAPQSVPLEIRLRPQLPVDELPP